MTTKAKAIIQLRLKSEKQLATLLDSLNPEAKGTISRRARAKLEKDGLNLTLMVEAEDEVALRSTLNAYLRWVNSTLNVLEAIAQADSEP